MKKAQEGEAGGGRLPTKGSSRLSVDPFYLQPTQLEGFLHPHNHIQQT